MTAHAKLSASGSHQWIACPGSVAAQEGIPNQSSHFADEGSAAHELAEICLTQHINCDSWVGKDLIEWNAIEVDEAMANYVQQFVDYVRLLGGEQYYEHRVCYEDWVPGGFGTSDAIVIDGDHLHVVDLKYGQGVRVDATENTQGILYALGAYSEFELTHQITKVSIHIVQPRLDHIDVWDVSSVELLRWGADLNRYAERALAPDAPRVPSEDACRFCRAKDRCVELARFAEKTLLVQFDAFDQPDVAELTDEQIKTVLDNRKLILSWMDALEQRVVAQLMDGKPFPGYKMVEGRATRSWSLDDTPLIETLTALGLNPEAIIETKVRSPAQVEKLLGKKRVGEIADIVVKSTGKPTLAPESDKRPSLTVSVDDFD